MTDHLTKRERNALVEALKEAVRIASDENGEVFGGNLNLRETAIINWKRQAKEALVESDKTSSNDNLSIHVHRAADKLFENDLIDGDLIRYDYLIEAAQMLRSITSPSTAQGGENE
jgi:hypothetical protein